MSEKRDRDLGQLLDLLAGKADALRKAGITSFTVDGVTVQLAAPAPEIPTQREPHQPADALDDPFLYPGGEVPTRRRKQESDA